MIKLELSKEILKILSLLNENGKGYIVGGYIRDSLLGYKPKDCDFCTDISYDRLKEIFKEFMPKEIGKSFGIIQIKINSKTFEIAKLRKEIEFGNSRKEVEVEFITDIYEDLKRRDLTVNAIAYNGKNYFYVENAMEDIEKRIARFVGVPKKRIEEDPLRILRAVRISIEKKLDLDFESKKAMIENKRLLKKLSMERVQEELFKILKSEDSHKKIKEFYELGFFNENFETLELKEENLKRIDFFRKNRVLAIANFFVFSKDEVRKLRISKDEKKTILNIIEYSNVKTDKKNDIKNIMRKIGKKDGELLLTFIANEKNKEFILNILNEIKEKKEAVEIKDLDISGKDLIELGIKDGKKIKEILEKVLDLVIEDPKLNKKEKILERVKEELCKSYH